MSTSSQLLPIYPARGAIAVPASIWGTPAATRYACDQIRARLIRRAAQRGLKPCRLTRYNIGRLLAGVPQVVVDGILPEEDPAGRFACWRRHGRMKLAARYRAEAIRKIACRTGWAHRGELFMDAEKRPSSLVTYPDRIHDMDAWVAWARVGAAWDLEVGASAEFWYLRPRGLAVELCRPGKSVLGR